MCALVPHHHRGTCMPLFIKIRAGLRDIPYLDIAPRGVEVKKSIAFADLELEDLVQRIGVVGLGPCVLQVSNICFFVLN